MSRRDASPRGGQFLGRGLDAVAGRIDRERPEPQPVVAAEFEHSTREGAARLALRIERFWRDRTGRIVACHIEAGGFGVTAVRSDLVGGLPRRGQGG